MRSTSRGAIAAAPSPDDVASRRGRPNDSSGPCGRRARGTIGRRELGGGAAARASVEPIMRTVRLDPGSRDRSTRGADRPASPSAHPPGRHVPRREIGRDIGPDPPAAAAPRSGHAGTRRRWWRAREGRGSQAGARASRKLGSSQPGRRCLRTGPPSPAATGFALSWLRPCPRGCPPGTPRRAVSGRPAEHGKGLPGHEGWAAALQREDTGSR